jgi:hypothetical protein
MADLLARSPEYPAVPDAGRRDYRTTFSDSAGVVGVRSGWRPGAHDGQSVCVAEMFRTVPWPFTNGLFPARLGAVVQRSVLDGDEPARVVIHAEDGSWLIGDGINDPNEGGASIATHIAHAIEHNSSINELVTLPPGHVAIRSDRGRAVDRRTPRLAGRRRLVGQSRAA